MSPVPASAGNDYRDWPRFRMETPDDTTTHRAHHDLPNSLEDIELFMNEASAATGEGGSLSSESQLRGWTGMTQVRRSTCFRQSPAPGLPCGNSSLPPAPKASPLPLKGLALFARALTLSDSESPSLTVSRSSCCLGQGLSASCCTALGTGSSSSYCTPPTVQLLSLSPPTVPSHCTSFSHLPGPAISHLPGLSLPPTRSLSYCIPTLHAPTNVPSHCTLRLLVLCLGHLLSTSYCAPGKHLLLYAF